MLAEVNIVAKFFSSINAVAGSAGYLMWAIIKIENEFLKKFWAKCVRVYFNKVGHIFLLIMNLTLAYNKRPLI
jgi:hypothetical protein